MSLVYSGDISSVRYAAVILLSRATDLELQSVHSNDTGRYHHTAAAAAADDESDESDAVAAASVSHSNRKQAHRCVVILSRYEKVSSHWFYRCNLVTWTRDHE